MHAPDLEESKLTFTARFFHQCGSPFGEPAAFRVDTRQSNSHPPNTIAARGQRQEHRKRLIPGPRRQPSLPMPGGSFNDDLSRTAERKPVVIPTARVALLYQRVNFSPPALRVLFVSSFVDRWRICFLPSVWAISLSKTDQICYTFLQWRIQLVASRVQ